MKKFLTLLFLSLTTLSAQTEFDNFLSYIYSVSSSERQTKTDSFYTYAKNKGLPLVEDSQAVFIYRGIANSVYVAGDFNGWNYTEGRSSKIEGTNFYYLKKIFEKDARLDYKFVLNGSNWILDPANPNTIWGGYGPNSELAMPEYVQPWEINYNPNIPHGRKLTHTIRSANVNKNFTVYVYLPAEYDSNPNKFYPAAYFQDGSEYIDLASAINVIDNLIDQGSIVPIIGVFVKPNNRNDEYAFGLRNQYVEFFANELVPFIDSTYRTVKQPGFRAVIGDSYGGNISGLISFKHPDLFGNCGLHSAAFQPNNYEVYYDWINSEKLNVKFYSVWGTYEGLYENMRNFRDIMTGKGYDFDWGEFHEGHSWGLWRATIDLFLQKFFPPGLTSVNNNKSVPVDFELFQNYPNPFSKGSGGNTITTIRYTICSFVNKDNGKKNVDGHALMSESSKQVTLKIYDLLGREIATLVNEKQTPGNYEITFDASSVSEKLTSGVYFYSLTVANFKSTKKMILLK